MGQLYELKEGVDKLHEHFADWQKIHDEKLSKVEAAVAEEKDRREERESREGSPGRTAPDGRAASSGFTTKVAGREIPLLTKEDRLARYFPPPSGEDTFTVGKFVRTAMGLEEKALGSGVALVPTHVSARIIDLTRALTTVIEAGAGTIVIEGPSNAARITADPTVYEHTEATADVSESAPTVVPVTLNPKALVAAIPVPFELAADSKNLDDVLNLSIAGAYALKVDTLAIATILADTGIPDSAAAHDPATWAGTLAAVTAALVLNQRLPEAHISTPANFGARAAILASTAGSWLGKPPVLVGMKELFASSMTADTAVFGNFAAGFAIAVRQDIQLEMVRFALHTSAQHILMVTARMAGVVLAPGQLYIQKKTP